MVTPMFEFKNMNSTTAVKDAEVWTISGQGWNSHRPNISQVPLESIPGENPSWEVNFTSLGSSNWLLAGVISNKSPSSNSHNDPTSFGWAYSNQAYVRGQSNGGFDGWQVNDSAVFTLDKSAGILKMVRTRAGQTQDFQIESLDPNATYYVHFNIHGVGSVTVKSVIPSAISSMRDAIETKDSSNLRALVSKAEALNASQLDEEKQKTALAAKQFREEVTKKSGEEAAKARSENEKKARAEEVKLQAALKQEEQAALKIQKQNDLCSQALAAINSKENPDPDAAEKLIEEALKNGVSKNDERVVEVRSLVARPLAKYVVEIEKARCLEKKWTEYRIATWMKKRITKQGFFSREIERTLSFFDREELDELEKVIDCNVLKTKGKCGCAGCPHESSRMIIAEVDFVDTLLDELHGTVEKEGADDEISRDKLQALTEGKKSAAAQTRAAHNNAKVNVQSAKKALLEAQRALEAAELEEKSCAQSASTAQANVEAHTSACEKAEGKLSASSKHAESIFEVHEKSQKTLESMKKKRHQVDDLLSSQDVLSSSDFSREDFNDLLIELGFCCYTESLAKTKIAPGELLKESDIALRHYVESSSKPKFGHVRYFKLNLAHIQEGKGMPPLDNIDEPNVNADVRLWSTKAVGQHLKSQKFPKETVKACLDCQINGAVLLSMTQADVYNEMPRGMDISQKNKLVECIKHLNSENDSVTIGTEELSAAVRGALTGISPPCEFPISFVRRCTDGFRSRRIIGEGGFGTVYRAVDPVSGLRFAVKRMLQTAGSLKAGKRELDVLASVKHPGMIKLIGHCLNEEDFCLIYEFGELGSLADNLDNDDKAKLLTCFTRVRILTRLAETLNFMHRANDVPVYHRDVKSDNVVLCEGYESRLIDCGLSKLLSEAEQQQHKEGASQFSLGGTNGGLLLGTPGFLCPSISRGKKFGDKAEVFAFGVTILEAITGTVNSKVLDEDGDPLGHYGRYFDPDTSEEDFGLDSFDKRVEWPEALGNGLVEVVSKCCGGLKQRPHMKEILVMLKALEKDHCDGDTVAEVKRHLTVMQRVFEAKSEEATKLKLESERKQAAEERRIEIERQLEARKQQLEERECVICYGDYNVGEGVECKSKKHFVCDGCFKRHLLTESQKPEYQLELNSDEDGNFQLFCPEVLENGKRCGHGSDKKKWSHYDAHKDIAAHCSADAFSSFLFARERVKAAALTSAVKEEAKRDFEEQMARELERLKELSIEELKIEQKSMAVRDMLTLYCPRCSKAFLDFTGCFALKCSQSTCGCSFCAICLKDCGGDSHAHVKECCRGLQGMTGEYHGSFELFQKVQNSRRIKAVTAYLNGLEFDVAVRVVEACRVDFE
eukprot:CAMPEP_0182513154 /NCGR_PEP_ID=MMETSP1321-20130603/33481_1 /TAXON_ID=91990 /ORGANISM="Bolidomonas sp., Strain RCC1657" /LENGTH=1352 /DNA_ID=CAMNT_0024720113 /DNA_START=261 /DNA_END=4316 /DNA_ORIENTATION=-